MKTDEITRKNVSLQIPTYCRLVEYWRFGDTFTSLIEMIMDYGEAHGMTPDTMRGDTNTPKPPKKANRKPQ